MGQAEVDEVAAEPLRHVLGPVVPEHGPALASPAEEVALDVGDEELELGQVRCARRSRDRHMRTTA